MWDWVSKLQELKQLGIRAVLVTVTHHVGSTPREEGAKMIVVPGGKFFGTIGGGHLEELALADAAEVFSTGKAETIRYPLGSKTGQCCGGTVDLFFEPVNHGPRLYLFGAGHVGHAVCRTLQGTPFQVHLIDERPEWIRSPEVPVGVIRHEEEWDVAIRDLEWSARETYVAIMTHRHDVDQAIIEDVIGREARYIGLIGSRAKWERFKQRMEQRGITEEKYSRVKCPIGIDIGGKSPQEVAISLAAELVREHYSSEKRALAQSRP